MRRSLRLQELIGRWKKKENEAELSGGERAVEWGICLGAVCFLAYFFYRSVWAVPLLMPVGLGMSRQRKRMRRNRKERELADQFRECILSVLQLQRAGYSLENSFIGSRRDMEGLFGKGAYICRILEHIRAGLVLNRSLEELLWEAGEKHEAEDIREFAGVLAIAKRNGGSIPALIMTFSGLIGNRRELEEEIQARNAGRRLEQKIMNLMPFGILLYVNSANPGYFDRLYHNPAGIGIMTLCLLAYICAYAVSERILE